MKTIYNSFSIPKRPENIRLCTDLLESGICCTIKSYHNSIIVQINDPNAYCDESITDEFNNIASKRWFYGGN